MKHCLLKHCKYLLNVVVTDRFGTFCFPCTYNVEEKLSKLLCSSRFPFSYTHQSPKMLVSSLVLTEWSSWWLVVEILRGNKTCACYTVKYNDTCGTTVINLPASAFDQVKGWCYVYKKSLSRTYTLTRLCVTLRSAMTRKVLLTSRPGLYGRLFCVVQGR